MLFSEVLRENIWRGVGKGKWFNYDRQSKGRSVSILEGQKLLFDEREKKKKRV